MINKRKPHKSRKLLDRIAQLDVCVRCGVMDGTVVPAHYCGPMQNLLGKGMGTKVTDAAAAALCFSCHAHMDQYKDGDTVDRSEEFLYLVVITHELLLKNGSLEVK